MTTFAALRAGEFAYGANCSPPAHLAGGFVQGSLRARRHVVSAEPLFRAYHELDDIGTETEAYGTVFQFPAPEYAAHVARVGSPKGYAGPAACCRLTWDIDRTDDPGAAVADARTLARHLLDRYGAHAENGLAAYFSGAKGFHLSLIALPGFHPLLHLPAVVKLLCLSLAGEAGVGVDPSIYDRQRLFRLPNTRHPRTGLYKRFLALDELFRLDAARIRDVARHPAGFAAPSVCEDCPRLADDWERVERVVLDAPAARAQAGGAARHHPTVPLFVRNFIGFGDVEDPGRAVTLFRASAALMEAHRLHGPEAVIRGLLAEPALKMGLGPEEVEKQIRAGIDRGRRGGSA